MHPCRVRLEIEFPNFPFLRPLAILLLIPVLPTQHVLRALTILPGLTKKRVALSFCISTIEMLVMWDVAMESIIHPQGSAVVCQQ